MKPYMFISAGVLLIAFGFWLIGAPIKTVAAVVCMVVGCLVFATGIVNPFN